MFERWVTSKATLADVAAAAGVTRDTARLWFVPLWERLPRMSGHVSCRTIVVDGVTVVRREAVALLASDSETSKPAGCVFAEQECHGAWREFFLELRRRGANPKFLVCDGQKGLLKARREVWPDALVQRCVVHVHRQAMAWLTKNPKTDAGRELRPIVSMLLLVCTPAQRDSWLASLREWEGRHYEFLKERTYGESGWWYTHRTLRAVRSLLRNAAPDMFRYIDDPTVPRTSNHVEGGLNSRIKELLRSHRGLSKHQRLALVCWYLHFRLKKPTRNHA
ncbi:transposase [Patescibacteria group bacterium]|nr:transposase [Patescibacteria group bacterium]